MRVFLLLFAAVAATGRTEAAALDGEEKTITKVVKLLEGMLEKSKADSEADRDAYGAFKCYCDKTTEEKNAAVLAAEGEIERMNSFLADKRAENAKLSQEVSELTAGIAANEQARADAETIRGNENADFLKEEADLAQGIDQLQRAIEMLQAVGADATISGDADSAQLMAGDATAAAKELLKQQAEDAATAEAEKFLASGSLLAKGAKTSKSATAAKKIQVSDLSENVKKALRAASLFLNADERAKMTSFLQAPGNYNAQSGEIVGILKNMHDTFETNLVNARDVEAKAVKEYDDFMAVKTTEHEEMSTSMASKQEVIGNNAADIASTSDELETTTGLKETDTEFLADLDTNCADKEKQYQKRVTLRTGEEAAVSQAISILHADDARDTFGKVDATSTGATSLLQVSLIQRSQPSKTKLGRAFVNNLRKQARSLHSLRLAKVATAVAAGNPFVKVLEQIEKMIKLIDKEEADDLAKKTWCEEEQASNEQSKADHETDMATLNANIGNMQIVVNDTKESIVTATDDLQTNRDAQASETEDRQAANAAFTKSLANLEEAEKILGKAIDVLAKYYAYLHASQGAHSYTVHEKTDSGGANIKRLAGKSVDELKEACSALAECVGFNSAGWLKSGMAPEEEWYDWDGGDLFVKTFESDWKGSAFVQQKLKQEPETWDDDADMEGQRSQGKGVVEMLEFIKEETTKEMHAAIGDERSAQAAFETTMMALTKQEQELIVGINTYKQNLADTETQLEEANENYFTTERAHLAVVSYLEKIEPDCTFYITNYEGRSANRTTEKAAMEGALDTIKATPAFQAAVAAEERAALGKCVAPCDEHGSDHAECLACQEGTSVFGYCAQNGDTPGCAEATATGSAAALG
jgi:hypothetical protein